MTAPTWSVEVDWDTNLQSGARIGYAVIGTDVISGGFQAPANWTDITGQVREVSIRRGRQSDMGYMVQGSCSVKMNDFDGSYNPANAGATLAGKLIPLRPLRVSATYGGTTYRLFTGYLSEISHDPARTSKETTISAVDGFEWLANRYPWVWPKAGQTVSVLLGLILDATGIMLAGLRNLAAGGNTIAAWAGNPDGAKSALALIQELLAVDRGIYFVDGQGRHSYIPRSTYYAQGQSAVATFTEDMVTGLKSTVNKDGIVNRQVVTKEGGAAQPYNDGVSRNKYGDREGSPVSSPYLDDDAQAALLARWLVTLNKDPRLPARRLELKNKDATNLAQQLARELGDYVRVNETAGGTSFYGHVESLEHRITHAGGLWLTSYSVQQLPDVDLTFY